MATSGSTNYTATAEDIMTLALRQCGALGEGEVLNDTQKNETILPLNLLVKTWQAAGLRLSAVKTAYLFPEIGKNDHSLTNTVVKNRQNDFVGISDTSIKDQYALGPLQQFTVEDDFAASQGTSSFVYYDPALLAQGLRIGDIVGFYSSADNSITWGTVTVHQSSSGDYRFQASDGTGLILPSVGDICYVLTQKAPRPLKILEAYVLVNGLNTEIPIDVISRNEYDALSNKSASGVPNQIYYDPQRTTGIASIWPQTDDVRNYIKLRIKAPIEDFDAATDEADLPQEWLLPLAMNLASLIAPSYGVPAEDFKKIEMLAAKYYEMVFDFEQETETSMYIEPEM